MRGDLPGRKLHAADRLATGNPVYRGASNAATVGTVDPAGYVDRERRSKLAASLLASGERAGQVDPTQLVGETASRVDRREIIRRLHARMRGG